MGERKVQVLSPKPNDRSKVHRKKIAVEDASHPKSEEYAFADEGGPPDGVPLSFSYCIPLNEEELIRARRQLKEWQDYREIDEKTPGLGAYAKEIRFYKRIVERFTRWFREHEFQMPSVDVDTDQQSDPSLSRGQEAFRKNAGHRRRMALKEVIPSSIERMLDTYDLSEGRGQLADEVSEKVKELTEQKGLQLADLENPPSKSQVMDTFRYHTEEKFEKVEGLDRAQRLKALYWWAQGEEDKIRDLNGRLAGG